MCIFGFLIVISVVVPPALIIIGWVADEYFKKFIHGPNFYGIILSYIANTASFEWVNVDETILKIMLI